MKESDVEKSLLQLVATHDMNVINVKGKNLFSLSEKGLRNAEKLLRESEDAQLFLFTIFFRLRKKPSENKYSTLKEAVDFITKRFNPDFLDTLKRACIDGRIKGLKLKGSDEE